MSTKRTSTTKWMRLSLLFSLFTFVLQVRNKKFAANTEKTILNYIKVRLTKLFLTDVCKPLLELVDFFGSRRVRCHFRYKKFSISLTDHMARFLKIEVGSMKPQELLNVELKDENIIRATDIILCQGVTKLLSLMDLSIKSHELKNLSQ